MTEKQLGQIKTLSRDYVSDRWNMRELTPENMRQAYHDGYADGLGKAERFFLDRVRAYHSAWNDAGDCSIECSFLCKSVKEWRGEG
jgi:hypothetical protein